MKSFNPVNLAILAMLLIPAGLMIYKLGFKGYALEKTLARTSYQVHLDFEVQPEADTLEVQAYLPESDERQQIRAESNRSDGAAMLIMKGDNGRYARWSSTEQRVVHLAYSFEFLGYGLQYQLDSTLSIPDSNAAALVPFMLPPAGKYEHHKVTALAESFELSNRNVKTVLEQAYAASENVAYDPITRFVGLCRHAGLPTRYATGIELKGEAHDERQWAEVLVAENWVPFDPQRGYFARIPASYLKLNHGATQVSANTANAPFTSVVEVRQKATIDPALLAELPNQPMNAYAVWRAFEVAGIPLDILKVILLLPLGALVVALFRNVIGLSTFGIFLPALIAMASKETGLGWGFFAFSLVILVVSVLHIPLERWGILSVPKMVILLVSVVMVFIAVSVAGVSTGMTSLAYVTLFPIVVVTVSAERFAKTMITENYATALKLAGQTLLVAAAAYVVMSSSTVESLFLTFPELFLVIIAINLILGQWIGMRLTELFRFKWIVA